MKSLYGYRRRRSSFYNVRRKTPSRKHCGLTRKEIIHILSSLALPLMLGIFTVVITFDQKNISNKQRIEDRHAADEQREQDLNISRQQRREDRDLAREQRIQDLNQAILQRQLERKIADETQNISEQNRIHQSQIQEKRYRDQLLTNYMSEMSDLLQLNNGSLTNNALTRIFVRLKTLTLIRQLDFNRNSQVIRFLYEAGQLNAHNKFALDLSESDLFNIDLSSKKIGKKMYNLYLPNVDLTGSSFINCDLTGSNFSSTILIDVNFSSTNLTHTDFSYTTFNSSFTITNAVLHYVDFSHSNLKGIDFHRSLFLDGKPSNLASCRDFYSVNLSNADLTNTRFYGLCLSFIHFRQISDNIDFSSTILLNIVFEDVDATRLNFSYSDFRDNITFSNLFGITNSSFLKSAMENVKFIAFDRQMRLKNNIFDYIRLDNTEFINIGLFKSSFVNAMIANSRFNNCGFDNINLTNATISNVLFHGSITNTNFDNAILKDNVIFSNQTYIFHSTFRRAQMQHLVADLVELYSVDMSEANLTDSSMFATQLTMSHFINTDFTGVNLIMADLSHSNMFNATITDEQLNSAYSIENTTLPNGTVAHDIPLLQNVDGNCNRNIRQDWNIEPPNSIIIVHKSIDNQNDCIFIRNQSFTANTTITMSQTINVTRFQPIFNYPLTKLRVISDCNDYVTIYITEQDIYKTILNRRTIDYYDTKISPHPQTTYVQLRLQFDLNNNNIAMCDNIQFKVENNAFVR